MTRLNPGSTAAPINPRRFEARTGGGLLPLHTTTSSGASDSSGDEAATAELLSSGSASAAASAPRSSWLHPHVRRRRGTAGLSLFGRTAAVASHNWKLLLVGKLAAIQVLALLAGTRFHEQYQPPPHAEQPTGPILQSSTTRTAADGVGTASDAEASAWPQYSVWSHGQRLFHSLQQRWKPRETPPHQSVSVVPDASEDGPLARRCTLPTPRPPKGQPEGLHNQAFFLGGRVFDRIPPPPKASLRPRGVVISATGTVERLAVGAYITAFLVRRVLNSSLPIEIYHVSDREEFAPELKAQLEALGDVRVIDLVTALQERFGDVLAAEAAAARAAGLQKREQQPDSHLMYLNPSIEQLASYAAKAYAMLVSDFQEAVLFDAGAVPFQDPSSFFALEAYRRTGFLVFRDYVPWSPNAWDWMAEEFCVDTAAIREYYAGTEGDSSCVLVDKSRNWDALLVAAILNGPLQHTTYAKLLGDKDTWVMAMIYAHGGRPLPPLNTVPGFLFVDWEGNFVARKVHGQLQLLKMDEPEEEAEKGQRPRQQHEEPGLLVPLYFNNQLFNFTQWQWNKGWTYVGSYDDYGGIYSPPHSLSPDCHPYPVDHLEPLTQVMEKAFDGVVEALKTIGSRQCGCRDDWPNACVTFIY